MTGQRAISLVKLPLISGKTDENRIAWEEPVRPAGKKHPLACLNPDSLAFLPRGLWDGVHHHGNLYVASRLTVLARALSF